MNRVCIFDDINAEREDQETKWPNNGNNIGEVARAILEYRAEELKNSIHSGEILDMPSRVHLRHELVQVAAVTVAMIEYLDTTELGFNNMNGDTFRETVAKTSEKNDQN